jgi:hypothetical protein
MEADWEASGHVVELDGSVAHVDLDPELEAKGVVLTSLRKAVESHPDRSGSSWPPRPSPPPRGSSRH